MKIFNTLLVSLAVLFCCCHAETCGGTAPPASSCPAPSAQKPKDWENRLCNFVVCIAKLAADGGDFDMGSIMKCVNAVAPRYLYNSVQFKVLNGGSATNDGFIANAVLTWGKWQVNGADTVSVNGMKFSNSKSAIFKASGRENSPSGTEGSFDIIQNESELAATVSFSVPYWGQDKVNVKNADGSNYVCTPTETTMLYGGPLSYDIICHKINNS
ncbi:hypothetical protein F8203_gp087 [Heliothis virescens ascovirus 3f]|uniref:Uncharacterized protein n=1 Tax=Heliothis virescens ascovirus 3f TaxID=328614 RepID=A0A171PVH4_9VIRU|nr:hypothetical protein F8203_gp087 [Heliothis virescens ascovirus 3f]AJP09053.1 hypothetical protein [Heliothis virescens ascovirus 3f]